MLILTKFDVTLSNWLEYNTYAILADIDNFLTTSLVNCGEFMGLDDESKKKYLFFASRSIDNKNDFKGGKANCTQTLKFPRVGIKYDCDDSSSPNCPTSVCGSDLLPSDGDVPLDVTNATILEAINIHNSKSLTTINPNATEATEAGLKSEEIGCVNRSFYKPSDSQTETVISVYADELGLYLEPYLIGDDCKYTMSRG